ncbi:MAG: hypothetical protein ACOH1H_00125 [Brevundimonas sp.]|jgi:F-type H+-transporting ATPase subunit b
MATEPDIALHSEVPSPIDVADTHASTEASHEAEGGGLPQFEFQHWFGQIVWLVVLFIALYLLISRVFTPRIRGVIAQRATTIATAVETARQVQTEAAAQAETAKAEVAAARASSRALATAAKTRVTEEADRRGAAEEAVVSARIAEAETAIGKTRDAAMANVTTIAADTAAAIVERLTGTSAGAGEIAAAVKGAA